jgi:hypothetical protein
MLYGNPEPWTWKGETSRKRIKSIGLSEQFAGFRVMSLKDFIVLYGRTWSSVVQLTPNENSAYEILVLVDCRDVIGTMTSEIKKKMRRCGKQRRMRLREQYNYTNVFNRIHGFVMLENIPDSVDNSIPIGRKIISLSLICSSSYSKMSGVGSELMRVVKELVQQKNNPEYIYTDIVLEVSNQYANRDEDEDEDDYEVEYDYDGTEIEAEAAAVTQVKNEFLDLVTKEFSRKILRVDENGSPFYNVDGEYIREILESYITDTGDSIEDEDSDYESDDDIDDDYDDESNDDEDESNDDEDDDESDDDEDESDDDEDESDDDESNDDESNDDESNDDESDDDESNDDESDDESDEPSENEYGGYWYSKGKASQKLLMKFYKKFGFIEDGSIYNEWGIFGEAPFPSMYCSIY